MICNYSLNIYFYHTTIKISVIDIFCDYSKTASISQIQIIICIIGGNRSGYGKTYGKNGKKINFEIYII